jgi:hypothetical protein
MGHALASLAFLLPVDRETASVSCCRITRVPGFPGHIAVICRACLSQHLAILLQSCRRLGLIPSALAMWPIKRDRVRWRSTDHRCEIDVAVDLSAGLALVKQNKTVMEVKRADGGKGRHVSRRTWSALALTLDLSIQPKLHTHPILSAATSASDGTRSAAQGQPRQS